jgi:pantoate--beta-alanine ligase
MSTCRCRILQAAAVDVVFEPATLYAAPPQQAPPQHTFSPRSTSTASNAGMVVGATALIPGQHDVYVHPEHLQRPLCGVSRPHFFRGVATVVTKLFHIVEPDFAIFGLKDFQQLCVIRALVRDLDFCIEVVGVKIAREWDGLARSSRNVRLTAEAREAAPCLYAALKAAQDVWGRVTDAEGVANMVSGVRTLIREGGGEVDYVEAVDTVSLAPLGGRMEAPAVLAVAAFFPAVGGGRVRLIDNIELDAQV